MDRGEADALVARLGEELGIAGLALDAGGSCILSIDEGAMIVSLAHDPAAGAVDLMTRLDEVAPAGGALLGRLLRANFAWHATAGATFAVEPMSATLVLQRRVTSAQDEADGLRGAVERLVATAEAWKKELAQRQDVTGARAGEPAPTAAGILKA